MSCLASGTQATPEVLTEAPVARASRNWVQRSLKEALPINKDKINQELKKVIFEAYRNKTIESTDWDSFELESCVPLHRALEEAAEAEKARRHLCAEQTVNSFRTGPRTCISQDPTAAPDEPDARNIVHCGADVAGSDEWEAQEVGCPGLDARSFAAPSLTGADGRLTSRPWAYRPDKDTPLAKRLGGTPGSSKNSGFRLAYV